MEWRIYPAKQLEGVPSFTSWVKIHWSFYFERDTPSAADRITLTICLLPKLVRYEQFKCIWMLMLWYPPVLLMVFYLPFWRPKSSKIWELEDIWRNTKKTFTYLYDLWLAAKREMYLLLVLSGNLISISYFLAFYICIFVYLYICIFVYLYICIFVYLYICISVYLHIFISNCSTHLAAAT